MSKPTIFVHFEIEVQVELPEEKVDDGEGKPTKEARERAIEAAVSFLPQRAGIYIDGEDKDPAECFLDVSDSDVTEVRVE